MRWLRQNAPYQATGVELGIGDDMAILAAGGQILVTCDLLLDGTHFDTGRHTWEAIGRKAAGCSLSDCAAMAVQPVAAVVAVAWPRGTAVAGLQELMGGLIAHCGEFGCAVVGGDTTSWVGRLAIDVTMLAQPFADIAPVRRSGAQAGDGVYVTGRLGGSLLGKHLTFRPRIRAAEVLARTLGPRLHALMDITDGLGIDLARMAEASGVGAILDDDAVAAAASPAAHDASRADGRSVLDHVLGDGEDFELLLAADMSADEAQNLDLLRVGEITADAGVLLRGSDGTLYELPEGGYEHL
ncbi:MAG: thiamine-monophosphate kinase [Phycisphaerales bacterium]|nr:thiamine-monophosphate kinase [Phycisphaerales bacterium]